MKRILFLIAFMAALVGYAGATDQDIHIRARDFQSQGFNFSQLPAGPTQAGDDTGSRYIWCKDCQVAQTCIGGGSGAWAFWQTSSSSYACAGSLPTNLLTTLSTFAGDVTGTSGAMKVVALDNILLDSTFASPTDTYSVQYKASSGKFTLAPTVAATTGLSVSHNVYSGGNITVTHASAATVQAIGIVMPSSGCPCRVLATWNIAGTDSVGLQLGGWINDGTNSFAGAQSNSGASRGGVAGAGISPVTYSNSQSVTFTQFAQTDNGTFTIKASGAISANIPSFADFLVFSSN